MIQPEKETIRTVTETITETIRDTLIQIEPDKASISALLECDSLGNVLIKKIAGYESGVHLKPPEIQIKGNKLTVLTFLDSINIYARLKDRLTIRNTEEKEAITIVKEIKIPSGWQWFQIWCGRILFILFSLGLIKNKLLKK